MVAVLGVVTMASCARMPGPATSGPSTTGSSQVTSSSPPSRHTATSTAGSLEDQLLAAALAGDADTVRLLVARGADVTLPAGQAGQSPLQAARGSGYAPVIATLEATLAAQPGGSPTASAGLLAAATSGDADAAAIALRRGADLETKDGEGRTPLILAATHDRVDVARLLVALGADPDTQDAQRDSAWLVTGVTGSVAMLEALLAANPDLTLRNRFGGVSLIPASERGHVEYVRRVVQTDIDVNHVNDLGWTALLEAIILGDGSARYQQIVRILLDAGARPGLADRDDVTAYEHARRRGQAKVAQLLERQ